jgi:hypothetical protein
MCLKKCSIIFVGVFLFLALTKSATAGDISGTWIAPTPALKVTMVFKVNGTNLAGTVQTHPADETEIKDGKVDGDKVSFYIVRTSNKKKIKVRFKGVVAGDEIMFTRDADGTVTKIIAKRMLPKSSIAI